MGNGQKGKDPILMDLDFGLVASADVDEWSKNNEGDHVTVYYYPFNNLPIFGFRKYAYPQSIPRKFIHDFQVPKVSGLFGQPERIRVIFRGDPKGIFLGVIGAAQQEQLRKALEQNSELQKENAKLRQENIDAKTSVSKSVKQAEAITGKTNTSEINTLGGIGLRPPNFGNLGF